MKRYNALADRKNFGPFTDMFILGATRGANGASDFTNAGLTQDFTLLTPAAGDQMILPLAAAFTLVTFAGTGLTAVTIDVGRGAGGTEGIAAGNVLTAGASIPAGAGAPIAFSGAQTLNVRVTAVGANLNTLTAGEIRILIALLTVKDYVLCNA